MDPTELRKQLKTNPSLITITGKEPYFIKLAKDLVISHFTKADMRDYNLDFIPAIAGRAEVLSCLQQTPFDSSYRLCIMEKNATQYAGFRNSTTVILDLEGKLQNPHLKIDAGRLYGMKLRAFVKSQAKKLDIDLDPKSVAHFIATNGNDIHTLLNELSKLHLCGDHSNRSISLISSINTAKLNDLIVAVAVKSPSKALSTYHDLASSGSSDSQLFGFMVKQFAILGELITTSRKDKGMDDDAAFKTFDHKRLSAYVSSFDVTYLSKVILLLAKHEMDVKVGRIPFHVLMLALVRRDFTPLAKFVEY